MEKGGPFYQKLHPSDKAHSVQRTLRYVSSNEQGSDTFTSPTPLKLLVAACVIFTYNIDISMLLKVAPFAGFTASECIFPQSLVVAVHLFYKQTEGYKDLSGSVDCCPLQSSYDPSQRTEAAP